MVPLEVPTASMGMMVVSLVAAVVPWPAMKPASIASSVLERPEEAGGLEGTFWLQS